MQRASEPERDGPSVRIRPYGRRHVGAPTAREAAASDRRSIQELKVPEPTLMENAGRSAALLLQRLHPRGRVVAAVGSGNNGGDALVLLRTLAAWGRPVTAVLAADRSADERLLHDWELDTVRDAELDDEGAWDAAVAGAGVVVDGILGTGIQGAPRERQARAIRALNRSESPTVALDVPSGVDATTGAVPGEAVEAALTVAFGWPKLGSLLHPGRASVGRLVAVEIGFPPGIDDFRAALVTPAWASAHRPRRAPETHKYRVGDLTLLAGRKGMAGAAVMAGLAALRTGVGLLRVASVPENREILQERLPEAVFVDATDLEALSDAVASSAALAAGPGLGTDERAGRTLETALEAVGAGPVLLDADALTLVGAGRARSLERIGSAGPALLTPHAGEMARISSHGTEAIRRRRVEVAREVAEESGCAVLLKGLPSLVAAPDGRVLVDTVGTSDLASAGMGDVLSGASGSFLAQGVEPAPAGALGLHHSGRSAVRASRGAGLIPEDTIQALPEALSEEGEGDTELDLPFVVFDQDPAR